MKVALCCICGYENVYLHEFVEYYKGIGFENIILYDHNDTGKEDIHDVIDDHIKDGFVIVEDVKDKPRIMLPAYNHCLKKYGPNYDWILFCDCDEFMCFTKAKNIQEYLSNINSEADCIQLNWMTMDDNGLLENDGRPMMERFTHPCPKYINIRINSEQGAYVIPSNLHTKTMIKCTDINIRNGVFNNPHFAENLNVYVNGDGNRLLKTSNMSITNDVYWDTAYLKHFVRKTITEFLYNKTLRGAADLSYHLYLQKYSVDDAFFTLNKRTPEKEAIVKKFFEDNKELIENKLSEEISDVNLYVLTHKKFNYDIPDMFTTLICGTELGNEISDNTNDNISSLNKYYCETTGIYWIWKNVNSSIKGQVQYRRFFKPFDIWAIKDILNKYDIVTASPLSFGNASLSQQYMYKHNINDLNCCKEIINRLYPDYSDSYEKFIEHSNLLFYGNCFIAKSETYDKLCKFCFDILFEFDKVNGLVDEHSRYEHAKKTAENVIDKNDKNCTNPDYQIRVDGFLFERLVTLFILHNNLKIYNTGEYILKEDTKI